MSSRDRARARHARSCGMVLAAALLVGACAGDPASVRRASDREITELDAGVPLRLAGLRVEREEIGEITADVDRPYIDALGLFSIREEDDLLQATLQVSRFAEDVDPDDEDFRTRIITNIGTGSRELRMGEQQLFMTGADRQTLAVWFKDRHLFVLSTRDGFGQGRALLRAAMEIEP